MIKNPTQLLARVEADIAADRLIQGYAQVGGVVGGGVVGGGVVGGVSGNRRGLYRGAK